jgi:hypothetical protein
MLDTNLVWKPRAVRNGPGAGAFAGTLYGVKVNGRSIGRGVVYQLVTDYGDVHTVYWDGTIGTYGDKVYPYLYQVDTGQQVLLNPDFVAQFYKLEV